MRTIVRVRVRFASVVNVTKVALAPGLALSRGAAGGPAGDSCNQI